MPEYSYGIARHWEASLQLPLSLQGGNVGGRSFRAELQYIAPHEEDAGPYWGFNVEAGRRDAELIPILGYRRERWHFAVNPGFDEHLRFTPAAKAAYRTSGKNYFGAEYYSQEGSRLLFLAWDGKIGKSDINLGVGRGFTASSDRLVIKAIYEIAF